MKRIRLVAAAMSLGAVTVPAIADAPAIQEVFRVGEGVYVRSLAVEPEANTLWVGTSVGALEIGLENNELEQTFTRDDGLANEYVFAIGIDDHGHKWFGTNGGGASRYRDGDWKVFFPMNGLADYWVYAFAQQRTEQALWIGTWAGANRYDLESGEMETYVDELVNEWVYALAVDPDGRVWFGTEGGVSLYDGEQWRSWTHDDGIGAPNKRDLPASANTGLGTRKRHDLNVTVQGRETYNPGYVFSLQAEPDGTIWAGTWGGGVSRFDGEEWRNITTADGLAGDIVYAIAREPDGTLWFGTNQGLSRYDDGSWVNYGHEDGLPGRNVYAVSVAPDGSIWAGTLGAVVRIDTGDDDDGK